MHDWAPLQDLAENLDAELPHESELPAPWNTKLTHFQKMLVLRAFRPEIEMRIYKRQQGKL